ncbi:MAG TPA: DUF5818 domain-containing protein [Terriglobia bacterium]|nr:DUF5818 domain-containing protein [Terriglobia bacterium]
MKRINLGGLMLSLALAAGLVCFTPALRAQTQPQSAAPQADQGQAAQPTQTFTGTIADSGGKLVLKDMASKTEYQLDDQEKAKSFTGKSVKVTGTLDAQSNTIHVSDIQEAPPSA